MKKYDLGCGQRKFDQGFIGVDISPCEGVVDVVYDLEQFPWTFAEDLSSDEIYSSHYVEHTSDIIKFMDEIHRILIPGGRLILIAPYYTSMRCWQDPTHKRAISEATFLYYNKAWREREKLDHYGIKSDFDFSFGYNIDPAFACKSDEAKAFAIKHYNNVVLDVQVNLTKK